MANSSKIAPVLQKLNIVPQKPELYLQALTHSSYAHERGLGANAHNERLEFLGDAVLELFISETLFAMFPDLPEGRLTRFRAEMVREETLSRLAGSLELGACLRLGKGEASSGGRQRPSILADALEALLGAIYLDQGQDRVREIVSKLFAGAFDSLHQKGTLHADYKTLMQEYAQSRFAFVPEYRIVSEEGPDHSKIFVSQILLSERVYGEGRGRTKKEAEQEAARQAWESLATIKNK